jgi:hypothetical protein
MFLIIFLLFFLLVATVILLVITSSFIGFIRTQVPFVATSRKDIERIVRELPITKQDVFYDLGSGDGRVCFLVSELSGAKSVGFELTWWTHLVAKVGTRFKNRTLKLEFRNQNFFKHNWSEATVIYGYLYPPLMGKVEEKFMTDCKPGTMAVIRDFPFPNLKPLKVFSSDPNWQQNKHSLYKDSKINRFKILLKSLWMAGKPVDHEIYIYQR